MHLTFRQRLTRLVRRPVRAPSGPTARNSHAAKPQISALEGRQLLSFIADITAKPNVLLPPNGRTVEVMVTGTFKEYTIVGNQQIFEALPGPKEAAYEVVDEYRTVEPRNFVHLTDEGNGTYSVSFPLFLPASRSTEYAAGRRFYINIGAKDSDAWSGQTVPVQVPISKTDRGPGPLVPAKTVLARLIAHATHSTAHPKHHKKN